MGGFCKAAEQLHLTQTALTRRIQKLENYLGVRLIDRTTRSVRLTAVGRAFLPQAGRIVNDMTSALDRLKDMSRLGIGNITMASIPTMAHQTLPAVIKLYAEQHPGNRIRIIESHAFDVNRAVLNDQAEFGLTIQLERHADLVEEFVMHEPFMFVCRNEHAFASRKSVTWSEMRQAELIMVSGLSGNRVLLEYHLSRKRIRLNAGYEVEHLATALGLVAAGVGTAILPHSAIQAGAYPSVKLIPLVSPVVSRNVVLIRRKNVTLSPATQMFYDLLARQLEMQVTNRVHRGRAPTR